MENTVDLKLVLKHLSNGTLCDNLCINCLKPLRDQFENVFTKVCKYDKEYCFADVIKILCDITLPDSENYNVCINCFMMASMAYKFYLLSQRSNEILNFYVHELLSSLEQIEVPEETKNNNLCISLPEILTETPVYDYNLHAIGKKTIHENEDNTREIIKPEIVKVTVEKDNDQTVKMLSKTDDENVVVIIQDNGEPLFYRAQPDGHLELLKDKEMEKYMKTFTTSVAVLPKGSPPKQRRKRGPMSQKSCSRCSVKYRFIAKLQEHMMQVHNVVLYVCKHRQCAGCHICKKVNNYCRRNQYLDRYTSSKISKVCKATTEDKQDYHSHLKTHTNVHQCALCNTIFKKRDTIIKHLKWHERMKNIVKTESAHICEVCGVILEDEESLRQHYDSKHYKKFTCYYCGRMYKGELSFNMHIKKHEAREEAKNNRPNSDDNQGRVSPVERKKAEKKKCMCSTCGRYFVDERALMWHQRLHNDERPYTCDVCGRGFVSQNRRNQHAVCAHTAPARRCPLCPALFHLRSMVNTHIKKVHLRTHKRRNRVSKHQNVYWRTETVPIQELSVDIQNEILELQAAHVNEMTYAEATPPMEMDFVTGI